MYRWNLLDEPWAHRGRGTKEQKTGQKAALRHSNGPLLRTWGCEKPQYRSRPATGSPDTRIGERGNLVIDSTLFMSLLSFEKGGDPVAELREHWAGVSLALDR